MRWHFSPYSDPLNGSIHARDTGSTLSSQLDEAPLTPAGAPGVLDDPVAVTIIVVAAASTAANVLSGALLLA